MLQSCAQLTVGPRKWNSYRVCGTIGYLAGLALALALADHAGFNLTARIVLAVVPPVALFAALKVVYLLIGRERIVFYEKALAAILTTAVVAAAAGADFRAALDIATLGVGTFLVFGRIGCLRVGCCHGRVWRHGIRYGREHVSAGFEARLQDLPVMPVQLLDGGASAAATSAGVLLMLAGATPGHVTALWAVIYGACRFGLELLRGDERPYGLGLSEAQWTALATGLLAVLLWPHPVTVGPAASLTLAALALVLARRRGWPPALWLTSPRHVRELDELLRARTASGDAQAITAEGLCISVHDLADGRFDVVASHPERRLDVNVASRIAGQLGAHWQLCDTVAGQLPGLFHLILRRAA